MFSLKKSIILQTKHLKLIHMKKFALISILSLCFLYSLKSQEWEKFPGPSASDIVSAKINNTGMIVLVSYYKEVWLSIDEGVNWENISAGLNSNIVWRNRKIYTSASGDFYIILNDELYALDLTTKVWKKLNIGSSPVEHILFATSGDIYYSSGKKLYRSTDKGLNFYTLFTTSDNITNIVDGGANKKYYTTKTSSSKTELYSCKDDGTTRTQIHSTMPGNLLYYQLSSGVFLSIRENGFFRSLDGKSWTYISIINSGTFDLMEIIFPKDNSILCITNLGIFKSIDNGINWNIVPLNLGNFSKYDELVTSISETNTLLVQHVYNMRLIKNLSSLKYITYPGNNASLDIIQSSTKGDLLINNYDGDFISKDLGKTWERLSDIADSRYILTKEGTYFILGPVIKYSDDQTVSWKTIKSPKTKESTISVNDKNHLMIKTIDQLYISLDLGINWLTIRLPVGMNIINLSNNDIIYGLSDDLNIWYSMDFGITWNKVTTSPNSNINQVSLSNNNVLYWNEGQNAFYSFDFGNTKFRIVDSYYKPDLEDYLIRLKDKKVFIFNIFNNNSLEISTSEIPDRNRNSLFYGQRSEDGYIYLTGDNSGVFKSRRQRLLTNAVCYSSTYKDVDNNCQLNNNLDTVSSMSLKFINTQTADEWSTRSNERGQFHIGLDSGTYNIKLNENINLWEECNFPSSFTVKANEKLLLSELLIRPKALCTILNLDIAAGRYRRCFDNNSLIITIKNSGTIDAINQILDIEVDPFWENIKSSLPYSSKVNNNIQYIIPKITSNGEVQIELIFTIACNSRLGQSHCITTTLQEAKNCESLQQNTITNNFCQKNIGSYDPNDKQAFVKGQTLTDFTTPNSVLEYLIRFQNTGTDTAFNITIKDQLDPNLDWTSFKITSSSHHYTYDLDKNGQLIFSFRNIFLPDSNIHEMGSHGFIKYQIQQKNNLPANSIIKNTASIYFDFNEPVLTNTVNLKLLISTQSNDIDNKIFLSAVPNPFMESTTIVFPKQIENENKTIWVYNLDGKLLSKLYSNKSTLLIKKDNLNTQVLLVKVISESGKSGIIKLIQMN